MRHTWSTGFCSFLPSQVVKVSASRYNYQSSPILKPVRAALSGPFPIPDTFAFPGLNFSTSSVPSDLRPELLGACLWTAGLYLGFSQRQRWGESAQSILRDAISSTLSEETADLIATFLHSLPFIVIGFGIDAMLRYANGSNAVWAVATGLTVAMYAGLYELARRNAPAKNVSSEDNATLEVFGEFAKRRLVGSGRCHLVDVRTAARRDPRARKLGYISDATLRTFIGDTFPKAIRSPNGYYRGLSVREETTRDENAEQVSSS